MTIENKIIPAEEVPYAAVEDAVKDAAKGLKVNEDLLKKAGIPQVRGYLMDALDRAGATLESAATVIAEAQKANGVSVVSWEGVAQVVDTGPDHSVRLKASKLNLEARGQLKDHDSINIFMGLDDATVAGIAAGTIDPASIIDLGPRVNERRAAIDTTATKPAAP